MSSETQYRAVGVDRQDPTDTERGDWVTDLGALDRQITSLAGCRPAFDEIVTEKRTAVYTDPEPFNLTAGQQEGGSDVG